MARHKLGKYPGDKAMERFLERHGCPQPLAVVRMRFLGEVASPKFGVQPSRVIEDVWNSTLPPFSNDTERDVFFGTVISLWNRMARHLTGVLVKLTKPRKMKDWNDVIGVMRLRADEIRAFLAGFGEVEGPDQPQALRNAVLGLAALADHLDQAAERLDDPAWEDDGLGIGHYSQAVEKTGQEVEGLMTAIIKTRRALQEQREDQAKQQRLQMPQG